MAVLVLAHFCEVHGPAVVFTTELHRPLIAPLSLQAASSPAPASLHLSQSPPRERSHTDPPPSPQPHILAAPPPLSTSSTPLSASVVAGGSTQTRGKPCGGCAVGSMRIATEMSGRLYVSGQAPRSPHAYARTKRAALRALSVESAEAPVLFTLGDESELYVLSVPFKIPDGNARGGQRFHALLAAHPDRAVLLHSYTYLVAQLTALARLLQARARSVHDELHNSANPNEALAPPVRRRVANGKVLRALEELLALPTLALLLHLRAATVLHMAHEALLCLPLDPPPSAAPAAPLASRADVQHLLALLDTWGTPAIISLLPHLLSGNQIIVRCPTATIRNAALSALATLLPPACVQRAQHGRYVEAYACNLLSLDTSHEMPSQLDPQSYAMVDLSADGALLSLSAADLHTHASALLARLTTLLTAAPPVAVLMRALQLFVLQVLHKARLFSRLARQVDSAEDERVRLTLQQLEVSRADLSVLRFWAAAFRGAAPRLNAWWSAPLASDSPSLSPPSPLLSLALLASAAPPAAHKPAAAMHRHSIHM